MDLLTTDLCDANEDKVRVVEPMFNSFGGRAAFFGRIATLKLFEDNSLVRKALESEGQGRVLVIDGGGSLRRALVGDQLAHWVSRMDGPASSSTGASGIRGPLAKWISACSRLTRTR
jgi:RraA family protein